MQYKNTEGYKCTIHLATGQPPCLLDGRYHQSKLDLHGLPTCEAPTLSSASRAQQQDYVRQHQTKINSYSDICIAACQPQFTPGQPIRTFPQQHQIKFSSKYLSPQIIHKQGGHVTYRFAHGKKWNTMNLTGTHIHPRIEKDDSSNWDDDIPPFHPQSSTTSSATPPVPPTASVSYMSPVSPMTPVCFTPVVSVNVT